MCVYSYELCLLQEGHQIKGVSGTVYPAATVGGGAVLRAAFSKGAAALDKHKIIPHTITDDYLDVAVSCFER